MRLPILSGLEIVKILRKVGWEIARQKGSHMVMVKFFADGKRALVVPNHREVDTGTLIEIIRQARLTREEFEKLL